MVRHVALVAVLVCGSPSWLYAQNTEFTVNSERADVHKGPSMVNPVIGKAPRGTVLSVTRELGSWVRISWPAAEDGVGFVHVSMGRISHASTPASSRAAGPTPPAISATPARTAPEPPSGATGVQSNGAGSSASMTPTTHLVGLGARMGGSTVGFGASARAAVHDRFGIQLEVSRYAPASAVGQQRLTSLQFAPSLLYSLPDKLTDYVWLRPYIGAGVAIYRSTLSSGTTAGESVTDNRLGRQVFGGTEVTFASMPRFTLSADYGYRWHQAPFSGFELGGRGLSVSGHWYVK
jgi:opacity protein-like surface antigen